MNSRAERVHEVNQSGEDASVLAGLQANHANSAGLHRLDGARRDATAPVPHPASLDSDSVESDAAPPLLELVVHRDPDGDTEIALFADGLPCDHAVEYHVDPGRGTADEANELRSTRYQYLTEASPAVRERLVELYARYPINSED